MSRFGERIQVLLDHVASGYFRARDLLMGVSAAGLSSGLPAAIVQQALTARRKDKWGKVIKFAGIKPD